VITRNPSQTPGFVVIGMVHTCSDYLLENTRVIVRWGSWFCPSAARRGDGYWSQGGYSTQRATEMKDGKVDSEIKGTAKGFAL